MVDCGDQAELARYWNALIAGCGPPEECGWLKEHFGVSWQIVPADLISHVSGTLTPAGQRPHRGFSSGGGSRMPAGWL
jgi:predicted 3-demethylubiquinone-9 3-methyltransferase (glyoxalase superfamily)